MSTSSQRARAAAAAAAAAGVTVDAYPEAGAVVNLGADRARRQPRRQRRRCGR